mgnify:CR=1 FL=1
MYGHSSAYYDMEHFTVTKPGNDQPHGYNWESKPGGLMRTFHPKYAVEGPTYGFVQLYYRRSSSKKSELTFEESVNLGLTLLPQVVLNQQEENQIEELKKEIVSNDLSTFESKFTALVKISQSLKLIKYSNPIHLYQSEEYIELKKFCAEKNQTILPLLFEKVFEENNAISSEIAALVLNDVTPNYNSFMRDVLQKWENNQFTADGVYIAPSPMNNTKNFIKKILSQNILKRGPLVNSENQDLEHIGIDNSELLSIYPNPINEFSIIKFFLAMENNVSLAVYDFNGKIVCKLLNNERRFAGEHNIEWKPDRNLVGLFICELKVDNNIYKRRILVQ